MELTRISTAGSVDDGKSTLIGRLLYDTNSIPKDKLQAIEKISNIENSNIDFSLFTDGLIAERQQGITIDVAYIYFFSKKKKYIIADSPGHEQYTRNMITGCSLSDISIILLDIRIGIVEQTKRHVFITSLFNPKSIIVAINKMDLVNYDLKKFNKIKDDFKALFAKTISTETFLYFVPTVATTGENLTLQANNKMSWYKGKKIIDILDDSNNEYNHNKDKFRMYIQSIIRPKNHAFHDFRGFSGLIQSGSIKQGDKIVILPSKKETKIKTIIAGFKQVQEAKAMQSITLTLEDNLDISRGNLLTQVDSLPIVTKTIDADICWMDEQKLNLSKKYILQVVSKRSMIKIVDILGIYNIEKLHLQQNSQEVTLNVLARVKIKSLDFLFFDKLSDNRFTSRFILIDEQSNNTVAMGIVR